MKVMQMLESTGRVRSWSMNFMPRVKWAASYSRANFLRRVSAEQMQSKSNFSQQVLRNSIRRVYKLLVG